MQDHPKLLFFSSLTDPLPPHYIVFMFDNPFTIEGILGPDGLLARSFKGFEFRPSQMEMAIQIQDAIQKKIPTIVEAGTGTGKTFGYLVPILLSGKKTVISTGTKNLQEQIFFKDTTKICPFFKMPQD